MRSFWAFALFACLSLACRANPRPANKLDLSTAPLPSGLLAPGAKPSAATIVTYLEGPAVDADGSVYFSDLTGNCIRKRAPDGKVTIFRADSGRTNGNTFDPQGRLISCEGAERGPGGRRRVVRTDLRTGKIAVLTDHYGGKRYNSPNDVCVDRKGRTWFSDPWYGADSSHLEMGCEGVYRIDRDGKVTRVLSQPEVQRPNGLAVTPDGSTLYVVDSHTGIGRNRKIWAFDLSPEGVPSRQRLVYDFGTGRGGDGMRLDARGNLWVAAGIMTPRWPGETTAVPPGVYVITPGGELLGRIPILEDSVTNLTFGGPDRKTLYVTAGKTLYKIPVEVPGDVLYPPAKP